MPAPGALQRLWQWLQARAERRLPALTRLRAPESLPIVLHRRRIYVLPTRFGLFFGVLLAAMGLGALNYNNNPALILCFLLASAAHTSLLQSYLALRGLRLCEIAMPPVHAGEPLRVTLRFDGVEPRRRPGLVLRDAQGSHSFAVPAQGLGEVSISLPTEHRGWLTVGRLALSVRRPLGLFVCWSWIHPAPRALIYPRPEANAPPLPGSGPEGKPRRGRGLDEQVHGLRDYRSGDPLRTIAWKRSAQLGRLTVREFEIPQGQDAVLDYDALGSLPPEARIRRLTRWVLDAERRGLRCELRVPGERIGPGRGAAHVQACLRCLALLPVGDAHA